MKRRSFLRNLSMAAGGQILLNGVGLSALHSEPTLNRYAKLSKNDKILLIIQLHGGNDGLNAVIPVPQYNLYYNLRPNLAVPDSGARKYITLDNTLSNDQMVGLHPDMTGMKALYDQGKLNILQSVGYENMNGSHFKGRDIWFGGVGCCDPITSGWIGRYLEMEFTANGEVFPDDFPYNSDMKDPLGLEFSGGDISLGFHTEHTIPTAISIPDPEGFFGLIQNLDGYKDKEGVDPRGIPPTTLYDPTKPSTGNSLYGEELNWILNIEKGTDKYAERLKNVYDVGNKFSSGITYPTTYPLAAPTGSLSNPLSRNLEIVSKLVHGGCQTKVYLVRIGGFDTHVNQVENYDNTLGKHAALMYHVSAAMKAFYDDLKIRGIDNKVLTVTMSEFGRRAEANNSYGSDHGTVAPMFIFGSSINPGVTGKNVDLNKVSQHGGNISDDKEDIIDHRVVFSTILQDWFEVDKSKVQSVVFPTLKSTPSQGWGDPDIDDKIPLFGKFTAVDEFMNRRFRLNDVYPNPVIQAANFSFYIDNPAMVKLGLYDNQGRLVKMLMNEFKTFGAHTFSADLSSIRAGAYHYKIEAGQLNGAKRLIKI